MACVELFMECVEFSYVDQEVFIVKHTHEIVSPCNIELHKRAKKRIIDTQTIKYKRLSYENFLIMVCRNMFQVAVVPGEGSQVCLS